MYCVSGTPWVAWRTPQAFWEYTRTGRRGSRHQNAKSRSCVASIAAGESFVRALIFAPSVRVMWRLIRMLVTSPSVPSLIARLIIACLGLNRCEYPMVNFSAVGLRHADQLVGLVEGQRDRLLQQHVLTRLEQPPSSSDDAGSPGSPRRRRRRCRGCRRSLPSSGRHRRIRLCRNLFQACRVDLGQVQFVHQGAARCGDGSNSAAPPGADDAEVDLSHDPSSPLGAEPGDQFVGGDGQGNGLPRRAPTDPSPWC